MYRLIYHNDTILEKGKAFIPAVNAGILYGWGVFTTIKIHRGKPLFFEKHWNRLERDSRRIGIKIGYGFEEIKEIVDSIILKNSINYGKMRINLIKGEDRMWGSEGIGDQLLIFTDGLKDDKEGIRLTISPFKINNHSPVSGIKSTSYLAHILSLEGVKRKGFDEAIVMNGDGYIAECIMANLFWIREEKIYTPSLNTGCLPGITREVVLEIINDLGIDLKEGEFTLKDMEGAKEIFITSSLKGIKPVKSVNEKEFDLNNTPITSLISRRFKEIIDEECVC